MDCYLCPDNDQFDQLPPRERIAADPHWRVAHAYTTSLPGSLVAPRHHYRRGKRSASRVHSSSREPLATERDGWRGSSARGHRRVDVRVGTGTHPRLSAGLQARGTGERDADVRE
jgi:hypothetical protein